jgi:hypothetical protein
MQKIDEVLSVLFQRRPEARPDVRRKTKLETAELRREAAWSSDKFYLVRREPTVLEPYSIESSTVGIAWYRGGLLPSEFFMPFGQLLVVQLVLYFCMGPGPQQPMRYGKVLVATYTY